MKFINLVLIFANLAFANALQEAINSAKNGDIIELGSGVYEGDIVINKSITLKGLDKNAVIKGSGKGNVIKIIAPNVRILNLTIENSGDSHTYLDAGIKCEKANNIEISQNRIKNALYGIDMQECSGAKITRNEISSKPVATALMGDGIRLWYSHDNIMEENFIHEVKDMVIWYSSNNQIRKNRGTNSRYSLHFMYAGQNLVEQNEFEGNSVGMFFMYSRDCVVRENRVFNSHGAYGVGIGMKDTGNFIIENNTLSHNARGFYLDQSPFQPGHKNIFRKNQILYNTIGVQLHATLHESKFENNDFIGNLDIAVNDTPGAAISKVSWEQNYFDDFEGFDSDKNGFGDTPYQNYAYFDTLWQYYPNMRFFYGTSAMSILNFIAKLAPFSEPELILTDEKPKTEPNL